MVVADLHVHTTNSDGVLTLETLPEAAREAGVEVVAVTDHDRVHPNLDRVSTLSGTTVIHGIELRVQADDQRIDLLGYGVRRTAALETLVEYLQANRIERARAILTRVNERLDTDIDVSLEPGIGRPHIARAIAESNAPYDYEDSFTELIGNGCPCYVARDVPSFADGRKILKAACDVVGLAHPLRYENPESALALAGKLDAVERYYLYGRDVDPAPVDRAIEAHDLLVTGGSDAHDRQLGKAGLDRESYRRFRARLESDTV